MPPHFKVFRFLNLFEKRFKPPEDIFFDLQYVDVYKRQMDMFPTALAAIGCQIDGNRLGLGTNLFSSLETLAEKYGLEDLNKELAKHSDYYNKNFIKSNS